ncbi:Interferon- developmental regulator 2 [Rhizophlyctis rosea]|uniref:Interferon- developmental regulator 2 n=1 Tax=Rhizophlyctis rosea TaxID=64517 RepID=A0AAD5X6W4_9FUNG|nr:Interferon- developmental regulator 2 [Rhizophlyctis rosea]
MKHARVKQSKGASRRNRASDDSDDDAHSYSSDISHITADSAASLQSHNSNRSSSSKRGKSDEEVVSTFDEQFNQIVDDLDEKRTSTRENALRGLVKFLSQKYIPDVLESRVETIVESLRRIIRREALEGILAARGKSGRTKPHYMKHTLTGTSNIVLSLCWITHGSNEVLYPGTSRILREVIKSGKTELKMACIDALAIISYMEDLNEVAIKEVLQFILPFVSVSNSHGVAKSAIDAYGLLCAQRQLWLSQESFNYVVDKHMPLLASDDVDVRVAAGENIAVLFEELPEHIIYERQDVLLSELGALTAGKNDSPELETATHTEAITTLQTLTKVKRRKTARFSDPLSAISSGLWRYGFKFGIASIKLCQASEQEGDAPLITLKFKHETVDFDSWAKIKQLNALRAALGDGMSVHFLENSLIQEIFDLSFDSNYVPMTSTERRLQETYVGKAKAKGLSGARGKRNVVTYEDYDDY